MPLLESAPIPDFQSLFGASWSPDLYNGLVTLFQAEPVRCWGLDRLASSDIAILGAPFDTAVTYRTGARFGPNGIRQGSRRIGRHGFAFNYPLDVDPLHNGHRIIDCGDVPMSYFDNPTALGQLEQAVKYIVSRNATMQHDRRAVSQNGVYHPRPIVLGGDHTITLSVLRAVAEIYGPVTLVHFDSHLDSCDLVSTLAQKILIGLQGKPHFAPPDVPPAEQPYTHGSMLWLAAQEGLITKSSIHAGIRTRLKSADDYRQDRALGFEIIHADEIEDIGYKGIVRKIRDRVQGTPVYISLDIDVLDPAFAPATGTPEIGGWSTREMKKILQGLDGLKIVGADLVEVAPPYESQDEITSVAAANLLWEILSLMVKTPA